MKTVWLDVTTTLNWHRPAVGIVRTEVECATYGLMLLCQEYPIKFCSFNVVSGYSEVSPDLLKSALSKINSGHQVINKEVPTAKASMADGVSFETRLKQKGLKLLGKLPRSFQSHAYLYLQRRRAAILQLVSAMRSMKAGLRAFVNPVTSSAAAPLPASLSEIATQGHPFATGDTYISLGLDWDQKDLVLLYGMKRNTNFNVVLFCYDVIPVKLPHLCVGDVAARFATYFTNVAWCADRIICISECSKSDLLALLNELGAPTPPCDVIRLGCSFSETHLPSSAPEILNVLESEYILFVSTIERRKNHEIIYRAYTRLIDRGVKNLPQIVFVGMRGWGVNDFLTDLSLDPRMKGRVTILNNVPDGDLANLYKHCLLTVFPSLYEGWGLPVAESLAAGKFCLASSAASIPEIGGKLIEYVDPWDVSQWADRLEWYVTNPTELKAREDAISLSYVPTSWSATAQAIFANEFVE